MAVDAALEEMMGKLGKLSIKSVKFILPNKK